MPALKSQLYKNTGQKVFIVISFSYFSEKSVLRFYIHLPAEIFFFFYLKNKLFSTRSDIKKLQLCASEKKIKKIYITNEKR